MKRLGCLLSIAVVVVVVSDRTSAQTFKAGFAECDISPEIGMEQPGNYFKIYIESLHDPCKVRAGVFDDGKQRIALVGIDALSIDRAVVLNVRKAIQEKCGIDPDAVLIGASHSHSSGPTSSVQPGEYDHASTLVQKLAYEKSSTANPKYLKLVESKLVQAVCEANDRCVPADCGVGRGHEDQVAFNRRFHMKNGLTCTHPGQGNPDLIEPAGPVDPEVGVIGAWDKQGKFLGCVVNFACHGTVPPMAGASSANYVCYLERAIRGYYGQDCTVVFLNGASGDITQVDNLSKYTRRPPKLWSEFVGGRVGAEALKVLLSMDRGEMAPIDYRTKILQIKRRVPRPERVQQALEIVRQEPKKWPDYHWLWAKEIVLLDAKLQRAPTADVEVQAVQVGPAVFITTPAEYFCQFGLEIKAGSPFPFTFPVSLANGCVGYVPTEEALGPRGGGYETRLTSYSNLEPSAGRRMEEAGLELARQMTPGIAPCRPPAPPFTGNSWIDDNNPPELD
ncbi:MAG: hypothetical protein IT427_11585 [Pirellulales bacterium]|nr:hypothetical protein [Pirellulales bacterium]